MDGYAVRRVPTWPRRPGAPVRLAVIGEVARRAVRRRRLTRRDAPSGSRPARRCPPGADAVVPVEETTPLGPTAGTPDRAVATGRGTARGVLVHEAVAAGRLIRRARQRPGRRRARPGRAPMPGALASRPAPGSAPVASTAGRGSRSSPRATSWSRRRAARRRPGSPTQRPGPARPSRRRRRGADRLGIARDTRDESASACAGHRARPTRSSSAEASPSGPRRGQARLRGGRQHRPVARRHPARQAARLRPRDARAGMVAGAAVRAAGQPREQLRHVRAVRSAGHPAPGGHTGDTVRPSIGPARGRGRKSRGRRAFLRVRAERDARRRPTRTSWTASLPGRRPGVPHALGALAAADGLAIVPEGIESWRRAQRWT